MGIIALVTDAASIKQLLGYLGEPTVDRPEAERTGPSSNAANDSVAKTEPSGVQVYPSPPRDY
ncbi:MAG: hypothetical protein M3495_14640 [Pseudomonadota bacterium]|nr:hypothetical protein [Gammaproteobacteria bacterium]MDQ3582760.1 hypothetical protein [Pseudomonadota bacterium]